MPDGTMCDANGCDKETCCTALKCGVDFHGDCSPGEESVQADTLCDTTESCTQGVCCTPKKCFGNFLDCFAGYENKPPDTMCLAKGCDRDTCCRKITCGTDFNDP